jgi:hypothetical protein
VVSMDVVIGDLMDKEPDRLNKVRRIFVIVNFISFSLFLIFILK